MVSLTQDRDNLAQFTSIMNRAYKQAKSKDLIDAKSVSIYDKLLETGPVYRGRNKNGGWVQPIQTHRIWRKRVARLYWREHGRPARGMFDWDIDWTEIWNWIMENIVPLLKMLLTIFFMI